MTVILDTDRIPVRERADALQAVFVGESPQTVAPIGEHLMRRRIEVVDFGPEMHLIHNVGTALQITRDARHVRQAAPESVAIGFQRGGEARLTAGGVDTVVRAGDMMFVDITSPYTMQDHGVCAHEALIVTDRQIGVSVDDIRAAAPGLARSPFTACFGVTWPTCTPQPVGWMSSRGCLPAGPPLPSSGPWSPPPRKPVPARTPCKT